MSGVWGNNIQVSIFGESHGNAIGINICGLPSGFQINMDEVLFEMKRRAPGNSKLATSRKEGDAPEILSGFFEGKTTGTPLCAIIRNGDQHSKDYGKLKDLMRPGHSDYPGLIKYSGFNDYRGGGHFSGRITAPLVFAGAICKQILKKKGIIIGSHISSIGTVEDSDFDLVNIDKEQLEELKNFEMPLVDKDIEKEMRECILKARKDGDSVGGRIQCGIVGIDAGIGDPFFHSVESTLASLLFSVPAVKGVEFGNGFDLTTRRGSQCIDSYYYDGEFVKTKNNNNGGVLGGITNGMPVVFKVAIKPTSSILIEQDTININEKVDAKLKVVGRHDPCIVTRAVPVIEAVAAIGILELMKGR